MMNSRINETAREADGDRLSRLSTKLACFALRKKNNSYPIFFIFRLILKQSVNLGDFVVDVTHS